MGKKKTVSGSVQKRLIPENLAALIKEHITTEFAGDLGVDPIAAYDKGGTYTKPDPVPGEYQKGSYTKSDFDKNTAAMMDADPDDLINLINRPDFDDILNGAVVDMVQKFKK